MAKAKTNVSARLALQCKSRTPKDIRQFYLDVQKAILEDGYRIATNWKQQDLSTPYFMGHIHQVVLYKEGQEFLTEESESSEAEKVEEKATESEDSQTEDSESGDVEDGESEEDEESEQELQEVDLEKVASLTKKADLLEYLNSVGVEVPEDFKAPNAIKKWVKETFK